MKKQLIILLLFSIQASAMETDINEVLI